MPAALLFCVCVLALAYFLIIRHATLSHCLKTLLRPKSTILMLLCSSRRRFSGLQSTSNKLCCGEHDRSVTNLQMMELQLCRKLAKAKVVTLSPGARCSWHEPLQTHKELRKQLHTLANKKYGSNSNDMHSIHAMPTAYTRGSTSRRGCAILCIS